MRITRRQELDFGADREVGIDLVAPGFVRRSPRANLCSFAITGGPCGVRGMADGRLQIPERARKNPFPNAHGVTTLASHGVGVAVRELGLLPLDPAVLRLCGSSSA